MSVALRITYDEYAQMIADGAFDALRDRRIELIHGELRTMTPPGPSHSGAIDWFNEWSILNPPRGKVTVRVQNPLAIPDADSAPQPDIAWVKRRQYRDCDPRPDDVYLIVEVADSSLDYDCGPKADLYAAAGIADYWVVSLPERVIHVFRQPTGGTYASRETIAVGQSLAPLAFPDVAISAAELFSA
jgi:Uma2 family endonuclease